MAVNGSDMLDCPTRAEGGGERVDGHRVAGCPGFQGPGDAHRIRSPGPPLCLAVRRESADRSDQLACDPVRDQLSDRGRRNTAPDIRTFVIDRGHRVGAHPTKRQPLPGVKKVWQGLERLNWGIQMRHARGEKQLE